MQCIVIIVILLVLGGAIFAIIKFIAPADEEVEEESEKSVFGNDFRPTISQDFNKDQDVWP